MIRVNLRLLEKKPAILEGAIPAETLFPDFSDELIQFASPVSYSLEVTRQPLDLLIRGKIHVKLQCACSRCLKPFELPLEINDLEVIQPLEGEEAVGRDGDFADLTPVVREDTLLVLPTKPLCKPECRGLKWKSEDRASRPGQSGQSPKDGSTWSVLDNLKL